MAPPAFIVTGSEDCVSISQRAAILVVDTHLKHSPGSCNAPLIKGGPKSSEIATSKNRNRSMSHFKLVKLGKLTHSIQDNVINFNRIKRLYINR
jgi:hypothetical protein